MRIMVISISFIFSIASLVSAGRPLSVDDAGTVDLGIYELEIGIGYIEDRDENGETELSLSIKHGLTERMDLGVSLPYIVTTPQSGEGEAGMGDTELSTKFNLIKEKDRCPGFSMTLGMILDTGEDDKGIGAGKIDYSFNNVLTKKFKSVDLHGNFGYTAKAKTASFGVGLEYPVGKSINLVSELTGENKSDSPLEWLVGTNFSGRESLVLDFGIGTGLNDPGCRLKVTGGLTLGF